MKNSITFILNDQEVSTPLPSGTVTLDFIRRHRGLTGTKESCREGECGSCTVLLGELKEGRVQYKAVASCLLPMGELCGKHVVTIEGLNSDRLNPIQQALVDHGAIQCGFCTPGIVVSLTGFFLSEEQIDYDNAIDAIDGNICRCTGYASIRRAVASLCDAFSREKRKGGDRLRQLVEWLLIPGYFLRIPGRLRRLESLVSPVKKRKGKIIAAGETDLFVQKPEELIDKEIEFISRHKELTHIKEEKNTITIGAAVTVEELRNSPVMIRHFPDIKCYFGLIASHLIRNRATAAGNIVNASPIGDLTIFLLPLKSTVVLSSGSQNREISLRHFFKGYKKLDMRPGEMIRAVRFPLPQKGTLFNFEKVSRRKHLDIAGCNSAISLRVEKSKISEIHLSAGGVAPVPFYLEKTCHFLTGRAITAADIREAARIMQGEISPISDVRGTADYKRLLLRQLFFAHFLKFFPEKIKIQELM